MPSVRFAAIAAVLLLVMASVSLPGMAASQRPTGNDGVFRSPAPITTSDLAIRGDAVTIPAGGSQTLVATVSNSGKGATAAQVSLSVTGSTVALTSVSAPADGDCSTESKKGLQVVKCTTTVPVGEERRVTLTLEWLDEGSATVSGSVLPDRSSLEANIDRTLSNNKFKADITTLAPAPSSEETASDGGSGLSPVDGEDNETAGAPELTVALTGPEEVMQGETATYTLTVTNAGTAASKAVTVTARQDADATLADATGADCFMTATVAECWLDDGLDVDESVVLTVTLIGNKVGTVNVTPSAYTDDTSVNSEAVSTTITEPETDLEFTTLSASNRNPTVGDSVTITIGVKNAGDIVVRGAYVETNVPDGLGLDGEREGPCVSIPDEKKVRCYLGTIEAGKTKTVDVPVTATAPGSYSTNGVVGSDVSDTNGANDEKSLSVTVSAA